MGSAKIQYKSRDAALAAIVRDHMWTGKAYSVYECPTSPRFHIKSRSAIRRLSTQ